jgi:hypothetical protein
MGESAWRRAPGSRRRGVEQNCKRGRKGRSGGAGRPCVDHDQRAVARRTRLPERWQTTYAEARDLHFSQHVASVPSPDYEYRKETRG